MNWKIAFALSAVVAALGPPLVVGCTSDACDIADQQLEACSTQTITTPSETLACTPKRQCQAICIGQASCVEINANLCIGQTLCPPATLGDAGAEAVCDCGLDAGSMPFACCMSCCENQ